MRLVAWATLLLLPLVIAACGTSSPASSSVDQPAAGGDSTTLPQIAVPESLQFSAPLVGGGVFDGSAYVGQPLAFWFWAPT